MPPTPGAPFGELPWFEKGLTGLAIKVNKLQGESGACRYSRGSPDNNLSTSKFNLKLDSNWKAEGDEQTSMTGVRGDRLSGQRDRRRSSQGATEPKQLPGIRTWIRGGFKPYSSRFPGHRADRRHQGARQILDYRRGWARRGADESVDGEMPIGHAPFKSTRRQSYIQFETPEKHVTTSTWTLPLDVQVEKLPDAVNMQSDMADFSHSCTQTANTITCMRTFAQ